MNPVLIGLLGAAGGVAGLAAWSAHIGSRVARAIPPDGEFRTIGGRRLHYRDIGQGPAIVMIHGLAGQMRNFRAVADLLAADHRVILIDRPGAGHSPGRGSDTLSAQAGLIAALLRSLDVERPWVVGHSLGGAVALALALDHGPAIAGLALIAPLTQVQEEVPPAFRGLMLRSRAVRTVIAHTLAIPIMRLRANETRAALFAPEAVPATFEIDFGGAMLARPGAFAAASSEMVAVNDDLVRLVARYPEIALPVRILYGRSDHVLAPAIHGERTAAAIPEAHVTLVAGGHMLPVTQPALVAAFIADALESGTAR